MRKQLIKEVADAVLDLPAAGFRRVAVDGVDGAGKTHFADELAGELTGRGAPVVRASVDSFHNPVRTRRRRGRYSPEGFYRDSFDYGRLIRLLLDPFGPEGSGNYVREVYDWKREREVSRQPELAEPRSILVVDGIFVHRDELVHFWDYTVWLEVPFSVSIPRGAQRGYGDPNPDAPANQRYVQAQRLYFAECNPRARASLVIDNTDLENPAIAVS
jgi:uridine kinase